MTLKDDDLPPALNGALSKYVAVWVWSIVVGINSGMLFIYFGPRTTARFGAVFSLGLGIISALASFMSWLQLLRYLRIFLIPIFRDETVVQQLDRGKAANQIYRAFYFCIISIVFLVLRAIADQIFAALRSF